MDTELRALDKKIGNLVNALADGMSSEAVSAKLAELEERKAQIAASKRMLQAAEEQVGLTDRQIHEAVDKLSVANLDSPDGLRTLLSVVLRVNVYADHIEIYTIFGGSGKSGKGDVDVKNAAKDFINTISAAPPAPQIPNADAFGIFYFSPAPVSNRWRPHILVQALVVHGKRFAVLCLRGVCMCGIAGFCSLQADFLQRAGDWTQILVAMRTAIAHRGHDQTGEYLRHHIGLAHTRLSIRDLAGGAQPMVRRRGEEDYNHRYFYSVFKAKTGRTATTYRAEQRGQAAQATGEEDTDG